MFVILN